MAMPRVEITIINRLHTLHSFASLHHPVLWCLCFAHRTDLSSNFPSKLVELSGLTTNCCFSSTWMSSWNMWAFPCVCNPFKIWCTCWVEFFILVLYQGHLGLEESPLFQLGKGQSHKSTSPSWLVIMCFAWNLPWNTWVPIVTHQC